MYLAIDVGGSKTLLAVFSEDGEVVLKHKIATNPDYAGFLTDIKNALTNELQNPQITYCCCAIPGAVDRKQGLGIRFGNLDWQNVPLQKDLSNILPGIPVLLEHDAALGGLHEALILQDEYKKVLYVAPGTGIAAVLIINGKIDPDMADNEAGHMVISTDNGQPKTWEDLASGRVLKARYGQLASEIEDPAVWSSFSAGFALGLQVLISILQPEVIVVGGGVGAHLDKFKTPLETELNKLQNKMVPIPPIIQSKQPEEAVIYGCYDFIKQHN
jgi:glucokinase